MTNERIDPGAEWFVTADEADLDFFEEEGEDIDIEWRIEERGHEGSWYTVEIASRIYSRDIAQEIVDAHNSALATGKGES